MTDAELGNLLRRLANLDPDDDLHVRADRPELEVWIAARQVKHEEPYR